VSGGPTNPFKGLLSAGSVAAPAGWAVVTADVLAGITPRSDLSSYFNGGDPDWEVIVNSGLRRLQFTDSLLERTRRRIRENWAGFELLIAPAGEGKSTALMQAVVALLLEDSNRIVLWRTFNDAELTLDVVEYAGRLGSRCIVASDNAHMVLARLHEFVKNGNISSSNGVQYIFASRDTDWVREARKVNQRMDPGEAWKRGGFDVRNKFPRGRLSKEDATVIVRSWYDLEPAVPTEIRGISRDQAASFLSKASATSDPEHGTLLGGLLSTRYSAEGLRAHLIDLLDNLSTDETPSGNTLADLVVALAIIDVAGAGGIPREIVAEFCAVSAEEVRAKIERRLAREALASANGEMLRGRHPIISRKVLQIALSSWSEIPAEKHAIELLNSTIRLGEAYRYRSGYGQILDVGRALSKLDKKAMQGLPEPRLRDLAVTLATHCRDRRPTMLSTHIGLSTALRLRDDAATAVDEVWMPIADQLARPDVWTDWRDRSRSAYNELATAMGEAGHHGESAVLCGLALSDLCLPYLIDDPELRISLVGLAVSLFSLHQDAPDKAFSWLLAEIHGVLADLVPSAVGEVIKVERSLDRLGVAPVPCPEPVTFVDTVERVLAHIKATAMYGRSVIWTTTLEFATLRNELVRRWKGAHA
jgi:hypothetical protein